MNAHQTSGAILQLIRVNEFCLSFRLDEDSNRRLRTAGADDALLEGLGGVAVCDEERQAEEEAGPTSGTLLYDPGSAAVRSLAIPGLGQFYTGHRVPGGLFLAGWAGALGFGIMSREITKHCLHYQMPGVGTLSDDWCPAGRVRDEVTERPYLAIGIGVAAVVAVASALHARSAANKANSQRTGPAEDTRVGGGRFHFFPARPSWRATDLVLVQLRF